MKQIALSVCVILITLGLLVFGIVSLVGCTSSDTQTVFQATPAPTEKPTTAPTAVPTHISTPTRTPIPTPTPYAAPAIITTKAQLQEFLEKTYSTCDTSIGTTPFTFTIYENDYITMPYDYWIQVEYNPSFFYDLQYSNKISTEVNHQVAGELQANMERLARDLISRMPNTKFYCNYYYYWYTYPYSRVGFNARQYYSWVNYDPPFISTNYNDAKITGFTWWNFIDDSLVR